MRCKRCKYYTQLMLLVGTMSITTPLSAHQLGHGVHDASSSGMSTMWHNFMHMLQNFAANSSGGYLTFLLILLAILAFVAFKVKRAERLLST